ncbi:MAG: aminotransferase class I/II-fold pyridoxal phosphate-dependent enzyme [Caldilineales bacterium]|nr:aminotransferase class I/II-fold pyridoxal phosphate-dependent enzyme [Caldilineales bacterium]MDW8317281.1 aminotransferase class I/II-fold pyridoxal phosphate-dependent enzyme [Anaerolineae bacterium]
MDATLTLGVERYVQQGQAMAAADAAQRAIMRRKRFDTIAVHGLYSMQAALANQGSIVEPAYFSSAQHFENSDHMEAALAYLMPSWTYTRIANPTVHYLEETLALLEGYGYDGEVSACAAGSGMAAIFMATSPFLAQETNARRGAAPMNIVASAKCYGGTFMLFSQRYAAERGVEVRWVRDPLDLAEWESKVDEHTRFVFGEMPSNPSLGVFDIAAVADLAHSAGAPLIVDSTVATPALMRPLLHGADIVVHSVSKSMASSGFAIAGALIARHHIPSRVGPDELRANFALYVKLLPFRDHGPAISPFNALMALNDLRTLRSRMDLLSRNALRVAEFLADHPAVEAVYYPGLPDAPEHPVARRYMWLADAADDYGQPVNRFGHLLSFAVRGGPSAARRAFDRLQMIWRATDLGRIKSVATIPAISTHQQQGDSGRALAGVPAHLIRLSVGGEHPEDIMDDLAQALA